MSLRRLLPDCPPGTVPLASEPHLVCEVARVTAGKLGEGALPPEGVSWDTYQEHFSAEFLFVT